MRYQCRYCNKRGVTDMSTHWRDECPNAPGLREMDRIVAARVDVAASVDVPADALVPGEPCPVCKRKMPMTGAQRQKRYRERQRKA